MHLSALTFHRHLRRCTRRHFVASTSVAFAGAVLAGCAGSSIIPSARNTAAGGLSSLNPNARSGSLAPVPIPGNPDLGGIHIQLPAAGLGDDPSTVYDFNGQVGRAVIDGTGTGNGQALFWEVDAGFMSGEYVSLGGIHAQGTFVFT